MVVNTDQDRIKALLTEAITVLCKNGLGYDLEFTIDGLLGITVDKQDVFLVKINETISKQGRVDHTSMCQSSTGDTDQKVGAARLSSASSTPTSDHVSGKVSWRKRSWHEPSEFHRTDNGKRRAGLRDEENASEDPIVIKEEIIDSDDAGDQDQYIQQTFGLSEPPPGGLYSADESDTVHGAHESKLGHTSWSGHGGASTFSPGSSIPSSPVPGGHTQHDAFHAITHRDADTSHRSEATPSGREENMAQLLASHMMHQTALALKGEPSRYVPFDLSPNVWPATLQRSRVFLQSDRPARPYSCTTCGKTFSSASGHKLHMNTHKGIYPYKCQYCGKGFTASNNLKAHITVHTKINSFLCSVCGEGFRYSQYLKEHLDKEHRNGPIAPRPAPIPPPNT